MHQDLSLIHILNGKMAIYPIPVWNEGDTREVLQGGTGTSVIKGTENEQLAKDFLAFAKRCV